MQISFWELLVILVILFLLFGTKKLRNLGGDLGTAVRSFRKAVKEEEERQPPSVPQLTAQTPAEAGNSDGVATTSEKPKT